MNKMDEFLELNSMDRDLLMEALHLDIREIVMKTIIERMKKDNAFFIKVKRYYFKYTNMEAARKVIQEMCDLLMSDDDIAWLDKCFVAFMKKKPSRAPIPQEVKEKLHSDQKRKCAKCGIPITLSSMHVDHIIPWDYVGDELEDNFQGLCSDCNLHKSNHVAETVSSIILKRGK